VEQTEGGTWLIGEECQKEKMNCDNFEYQEDAQDLFEKCGGLENDIHRLDGDKDGVVCEALPAR
jgi:micrococcal nuclease